MNANISVLSFVQEKISARDRKIISLLTRSNDFTFFGDFSKRIQYINEVQGLIKIFGDSNDIFSDHLNLYLFSLVQWSKRFSLWIMTVFPLFEKLFAHHFHSVLFVYLKVLSCCAVFSAMWSVSSFLNCR